MILISFSRPKYQLLKILTLDRDAYMQSWVIWAKNGKKSPTTHTLSHETNKKEPESETNKEFK